MESKSISELEGWKWRGEIPMEETHSNLEYRFYKLHDIPLSDLDLSDIRFLIGQNSGLEYIVPFAISKLKENIFIEAEYYPGDLLCSLLLINDDPNYWSIHPYEKQQVIELYADQKKNMTYLGVPNEIYQLIKEAYKNFK